MQTTPTLTIAAIKMFVRNRQALFFTLFMPLLIMVVFSFVGLDKAPKINLGIAVRDPDAATQSFIEQLKKFDAFTVTVGSETDERQALGKGDRALVMILPDNFFPGVSAPGLAATAPKELLLLENVAQSQFAKTGESIIRQVLDQTTLRIVNAPSFFTIKTQDVSVRNTRYVDFLLPGIVGMALMQMAVFSVAFVFADYKEKGILKRLLATPMKPFQFVTAQVITRLLVALAQTAILIAVGVWLFNSHIYGSLWLIGLVALLGGLMFLGLGFTISGLANTVESVPAIANLVVFPMLFLGGTFFPIDNMPVVLQNIVNYLPLQYLTHGLREVMTNGAGWSVIDHDVYWMIGWSVILVGTSILTFRFEERRV